MLVLPALEPMLSTPELLIVATEVFELVNTVAELLTTAGFHALEVPTLSEYCAEVGLSTCSYILRRAFALTIETG